MPSRPTSRPPRPSFKRRALLAGQRLLGASGAGDLYAGKARPNEAIVLMYHSVCDGPQDRWVAPRNRMAVAGFERQLQRLAQSGRVVPISRIVPDSDGEPAPAGSIILTFDDGYLDNLEVVAPLLAKYELPAVLYLATAYVADAAPQWADVLYAAIEHRRRDELAVDAIGSWNLADSPQREEALYTIGRHLIEADRAARDGLLTDIHSQLEPAECDVRLTMNFDDVRRLAEQYPEFELGVHTADHIDLSSVSTDAAVAEVERSMADFKRELGREAEHFSFPYSRSTSEVIDRLREIGLRTAMTGEGVVPLDAVDPFDIHRLESPSSMALFRYWTSGAHPTLTRKIFGRS